MEPFTGFIKILHCYSQESESSFYFLAICWSSWIIVSRIIDFSILFFCSMIPSKFDAYWSCHSKFKPFIPILRNKTFIEICNEINLKTPFRKILTPNQVKSKDFAIKIKGGFGIFYSNHWFLHDKLICFSWFLCSIIFFKREINFRNLCFFNFIN